MGIDGKILLRNFHFYCLLHLMICNSTKATCVEISTSTEMFQTAGKTLYQWDIGTFYTNNLVKCVRLCVKEHSCRSVNFNEGTNKCELKLESHVTKNNYLLDTLEAGLQYYNVRDLIQAKNGGCQYSTCYYNQLCQDSPSRSQTVFSCSNCNYVDGCFFNNCPNKTHDMSSISTDNSSFSFLGCYQSDKLISNVNKTQLVTYRGSIDWLDLEGYLKRCAVETKTAKKSIFGMEFYGECYSIEAVDVNFLVPLTPAQCLSYVSFLEGLGGASNICLYEFVS